MAKLVLIVDDDPTQRRILEETIKRLGFETKTAQRGEQALQILDGPDGAAISLVLLDLVMPGLDGMGVLERMLAKRHHPPVIVQTANGSIDAAIARHARRRRRLRRQAGVARAARGLDQERAEDRSPGRRDAPRIKKKAEGTLTFADLVMRGAGHAARHRARPSAPPRPTFRC